MRLWAIPAPIGIRPNSHEFGYKCKRISSLHRTVRSARPTVSSTTRKRTHARSRPPCSRPAQPHSDRGTGAAPLQTRRLRLHIGWSQQLPVRCTCRHSNASRTTKRTGTTKRTRTILRRRSSREANCGALSPDSLPVAEARPEARAAHWRSGRAPTRQSHLSATATTCPWASFSPDACATWDATWPIQPPVDSRMATQPRAVRPREDLPWRAHVALG